MSNNPSRERRNSQDQNNNPVPGPPAEPPAPDKPVEDPFLNPTPGPSGNNGKPGPQENRNLVPPAPEQGFRQSLPVAENFPQELADGFIKEIDDKNRWRVGNEIYDQTVIFNREPFQEYSGNQGQRFTGIHQLPEAIQAQLLRHNSFSDALSLDRIAPQLSRQVFKQFFRLNCNRKFWDELRKVLKAELKRAGTQIPVDQVYGTISTEMDDHLIRNFKHVAQYCRQLIFKKPLLQNGFFAEILVRENVLQSLYIQVEDKNKPFLELFQNKCQKLRQLVEKNLAELRVVVRNEENYALQAKYLFHEESEKLKSPLNSFEFLKSEIVFHKAFKAMDPPAFKCQRIYVEDFDISHGVMNTTLTRPEALLELHICWLAQQVQPSNLKRFSEMLKKLEKIEILALEFRWETAAPQHEIDDETTGVHLLTGALDRRESSLRKLSLDFDYNNYKMQSITNSQMVKNFRFPESVRYLRIYVSDLGLLPLENNDYWDSLETLEIYFHEYKMYNPVWDRTEEQYMIPSSVKGSSGISGVIFSRDMVRYKPLMNLRCLKLSHLPTFRDTLTEVFASHPNITKVVIKAARESMYGQVEGQEKLPPPSDFVGFIEALKNLTTLVFEDNYTKPDMSEIIRIFEARARANPEKVFKIVLNDGSLPKQIQNVVNNFGGDLNKSIRNLRIH